MAQNLKPGYELKICSIDIIFSLIAPNDQRLVARHWKSKNGTTAVSVHYSALLGLINVMLQYLDCLIV